MFSQTSRFETIHLFVSNHVETVVLLNNKKVDGYIDIELNL